jgi:hypothetical protein
MKTNTHLLPPERTSRLSLRAQGFGALAAALCLGLGFWLYSHPEVVIMLSEQLWACF